MYRLIKWSKVILAVALALVLLMSVEAAALAQDVPRVPVVTLDTDTFILSWEPTGADGYTVHLCQFRMLYTRQNAADLTILMCCCDYRFVVWVKAWTYMGDFDGRFYGSTVRPNIERWIISEPSEPIEAFTVPVTLDAPELTFDGQYLRWTAPDADTVTTYVNGVHWGIILTEGVTYEDIDSGLDTFRDSLFLRGPGTHEIQVRGISFYGEWWDFNYEAVSELSNAVTIYVPDIPRLPTPTGFAVNQGVLTWNPIEGAVAYRIDVFTYGGDVGMPVVVEGASYDIAERFRLFVERGGSAAYGLEVMVQARGDFETYFHSEFSEWFIITPADLQH